MSRASSLTEGPNADNEGAAINAISDIGIAIQRQRLTAMHLRWVALTQQLRQRSDALAKLPASALLRELRELEASTARELGAGAARAPQPQGVIVVMPNGMPIRPEIPVASIVSRAARENIAATADNSHYREPQYSEGSYPSHGNGSNAWAGPVVVGAGSSAVNGSASSPPASSALGSAAKPLIPPYSPLAEGAPGDDPMSLISTTHTEPCGHIEPARGADGGKRPPDSDDEEIATLVARLGGRKKLKRLLLMLLSEE